MRLKAFIAALSERSGMKWHHNSHGNLRTKEGHCPINSVADGEPDPHAQKADAAKLGLPFCLTRVIAFCSDDWLAVNHNINSRTFHDLSNTQELRRLLLDAVGIDEKEDTHRKPIIGYATE